MAAVSQAAIAAGVVLRAVADVVLYGYVPVHLMSVLGEGRYRVAVLAAALPAACRVVLAPLWGRSAARPMAPRHLMPLGLTGYAGLMFAVTTARTGGELLAWMALASLVASSFNPASKLALAQGSPRVAAHALSRWFQWEALGYVLGGVILGRSQPWGMGGTFSLVQVLGPLLVVAAAAVAILHKAAKGGGAPAEPGRRSGVSQPSWLPAAWVLYGASLAWEFFGSVYVLYLTQHLGASMDLYGATVTSATVLSWLAYRVMERWGAGKSPGRVISWGAGALLGLMLMASSGTVAGAAVAYLIPASALLRVGAYTQAMGAGRAVGTAVGGMEAAEGLAAILGAVLGGITADMLGIESVPRLAALLTLLVLAGALRLRA
ncbi:hypothetical protein [Limnochorda pilosa]|uniref:MFS transporter n=1 Tax=Limnochorda pilosa TaxID=1555112 RepID=A0A0K2SGC6_LIMPI|nr:hypothetical protein [Limnochorda pilosa]BAS25904.1 hypothetical protein LIP_0047 [Limnochorda pilosa]